MTTTTLPHRLEIWSDGDAENPCGEDMPWKLHSFSTRHINFVDPYTLLKPINKFDEVFAKTVGLQRKLDTGTAFLLPCYTHGDSCWSLRNEGMQCQFDTARTAGIIIYTEKPKWLPKSFDERAAVVRRILETYSNWCNGHCYGYTLDGESCGGFYDMDDLCEAVKEEIDDEPVIVEEPYDLFQYAKHTLNVVDEKW